MFDNLVTVFKYIGDCYFYVVGEIEENEIILGAVLQGFYEAVASLLSVVDKKAVLENLDLVLLCLCHLLLSCFCSLLMSSAYHQPEGLSFGATGKALPHLAGDEDPAAGPLARAYSVLEAVHTKFFAGPAGGDVRDIFGDLKLGVLDGVLHRLAEQLNWK